MFLDMVGYSALMARDEARAMHHVRALEEILRREIPAAGGRLVKLMGDGSMAEFVTAGAAVACAGKIQRLIAAGYASDAPEDRYQVRIGLHLGEVAEEKGDLFGDAVNIAARIQPLADPGGIAMSEVVHVQVKNQGQLHGTFLPPVRLKNIPEPVRVFVTCPPGEGYVKWRARRLGLVRRACVAAAVIVATAAGVLLGVRYLPVWLGPHRIINFPFPQNRDYAHGSRASQMSADRIAGEIQRVFEPWRRRFITREGAPPGTWRAMLEDGTTVSGCIGEAMLVLVAMDNARNRTQEQFDGLWRYHQSFLDSQGLMHWHVDAAGKVIGSNAATSTEVDIALALLLAHRQWSREESSYYLTEARALVARIAKACVEPETFILRGGDAGGGTKLTRPSSFSPAHLGLFVSGGAGDRAFWENVIRANYGVIERCLAKRTSGFVPANCDGDCGEMPPESYAFQPWSILWRIGLDYLWFGERPGRTGRVMLEQATTFAIQKAAGDPAALGELYSVDGDRQGEPGVAHAMLAFGIAAQSMESQKTWMNNLLDKAIQYLGHRKEPAFSDAWSILGMLTMSGGFPNLWALETSGTAKGAPPVALDFAVQLPYEVSYSPGVSASAFLVGDGRGGGALKLAYRKPSATDICEVRFAVGQDWTSVDGFTVAVRAEPAVPIRVTVMDGNGRQWFCDVSLTPGTIAWRIPFESLELGAWESPRDAALALSNVRSVTVAPGGLAGTLRVSAVAPLLASDQEPVRSVEPLGFDAAGQPWSYSGSGGGMAWAFEGTGSDRVVRIRYTSTAAGFWGIGFNVGRDLSRRDALRVRAKSGAGRIISLVLADADGERWRVRLRPAPVFKDYDLAFDLFTLEGKQEKGKNGRLDLSRIDSIQVAGSGEATDDVWVASFAAAGTGQPAASAKTPTAPPKVALGSPDLIGGLETLRPYAGKGATLKAAMEGADGHKAMRVEFRSPPDGYWGVPFAPTVQDWRPYQAIAVRVRSRAPATFRILVKDWTGDSWVVTVKATVKSRRLTIPLKTFILRPDEAAERKEGVFDLNQIKDMHIIQETGGTGGGTVWIEALELVR